MPGNMHICDVCVDVRVVACVYVFSSVVEIRMSDSKYKVVQI
jgi:hypothetical protein